MRTSQSSQSNTQKIVLIVLGVVLVGTVFFLPSFVDGPWIASDTEDLAPVPVPSAETVAPSTAAELKQYRQDSQGVLAEIVLIRDRLVEQNVETWAQAEFHNAMGKVEDGDEQYSYGNYGASLERYRDARKQLLILESLGQRKLADAKREGFEAIENLNPVVAASASELATAIAADDPEVQRLVARVETLEPVRQAIETGDYALERDRYQEAQAAYREALALDPAHQRAAQLLATANNEVTGGAFRAQMSQGFAALQQGNYEGARAAFNRAGQIQPGNPAVATALAQVANLEAQSEVDLALAQAARLESDEQWSDAVAIYQSLLETDPSLADAKARLLPSRIRAELDQRLVTFIDEPLLLSNKSEYEKARKTLEDARGIGNPGPRLQAQVEELQTLVQRATLPVNVVFESDNQTHVVLYRVAELGQFATTSMQLRPGRYIAAGTRKGFRDVRVEFTITGEPMEQAIVVRCEEPIG